MAGGSKGVGRETVSSLIDAGKSVVAMVRTEEAKKDLERLGATAIIGDAFTYKDVEDSMWGCDAAVTTLGGVTEGKRVDYDGNRNVVEAAGSAFLPRFFASATASAATVKKRRIMITANPTSTI